MKRIIVFFMALSLLTACVSAIAEGPRSGGRGNGAEGGSMQTLNEGIAYMNGDGVDQELTNRRERRVPTKAMECAVYASIASVYGCSGP